MVPHGVHCGLAAVDGAAGLSVVDPAGQLADDHQVRAVDTLAAQWRRVREGGEETNRTEVCEAPHLLPQGQESRLRPYLGIKAVSAGIADGSQEHGVCRPTGLQGVFGERDAVAVVGGPAHVVEVQARFVTEALGCRPKH